jgi:deglycase
MFEKKLEGIRIAVLAADGFEQVEVTRPVKSLQKQGAEVEIVSLRPGSIQGMNLLFPGKKIDVDRTVFTADAKHYDGLHIPGGFINPDFIRQSNAALDFVRDFEFAGKPISVICHGPWVLISAGLMPGRRITSCPGIQHDVRNAGGLWVDEAVVRDGNWISSRGPQDLIAFDRAIVKHFAQRTHRDAVSVRGDGKSTWAPIMAGGIAATAVGLVANKRLRAHARARSAT